MIKLANQRRIRLLTTASATVAAIALSVPAVAGDTTVTPAAVPPPIATTTVDAHAIINEVQDNLNSISASVSDSTISSESPSTPTSSTSVTISANTMAASASANDFENDIDLASLPGVLLDDGDGAASLGYQFNIGPVSAGVTNNEISSLYTDFTLGSIVATDNLIAASASGNSGSTELSGAILPEFDSAAPGSSALNTDTAGDWLAAEGSLVASTLQIQSDLDGLSAISNTATASDNRILLTILNTLSDSEVIASPVLDDNTISATVSGNTSDSTISIEGGPTFAGTAVVTNGQVNSATNSISSIAALNEGAVITATIAADDVNTSDDAELQGALSVSGNAITTAAAGNQALGSVPGEAGNRILIANGMSYEGNGTVAPGAASAYDAGDAATTVAADLIINNSQGNVGNDEVRLAITATTDDGVISAVVDDILDGAVTVQGNDITASASGNAASSAFASGTGMPSFTGSAAVANQQSNFYTDVAARSTGDIYAQVTDDDDLTGSDVLVDGNTVGATGYGNSINQSLSLSAVDQTLTSVGVVLTGGTDGATDDGNASATGSLTVTNLQSLYNADVDAEELHSIYAVTASDQTVENSSVGVTGNVGEAVSVGNNATNALALSGTTVGAGAGIASVQINDDDGDDDDEADGTANSEGVVYASVAEVVSSSVTVSGNLQRAITYGGSASNALTVGAAETVTVDGSVSTEASVVTSTVDTFLADPQPVVTAAYGVLNVQSLNGQLVSTASGAGWSPDGSSFLLEAADSVTDSTLVNGGTVVDNVVVGGNVLVAAAYGADATNSGSMTIGNLDSSSDDFVSVLSVTNVQEVSDLSSVTAQASGPAAVSTTVGGEVNGSSIATSYNTAQAVVFGNRADNDVAVTANNIDTEADFFGVGIVGEMSIEAGVATADASFTINNVQTAGGDLLSTLLNDLDPEDADASVAIVTDIEGEVVDSSVSSDGNLLSSGATANRADNAVVVDGNDLATTAGVTNLQLVSEDASIQSYIGIDGDDAANIGGVTVALGSTVEFSTVTVSNNVVLGSVTGNSAANSATLDGNNVEDGSDHLLTYAIADFLDVQADGDVMVASLQVVGGEASLDSEVYSTFGIDTDEDVITGSSLSVDGNVQSSRSVANTIENTVELLATNTAAGASLATTQVSGASVNAVSNVDIFTPVVSEGSSISMSDNENLALGVQNNAINTLTVDTTNADPVFNPTDALAGVGPIFGVSAFGDHVLLNQQLAEGPTSATAVTNIYNDDFDDGETTGLVDGSVTVTGNVTTAEASANRAINVANVGADATLAASAAVTNAQSNSGTVSATASTFAGVAIAGDDVPNAAAVSGSAILVGDNTTTSLARGNAATTVLNYVAGSTYAAGTGDAANSTIDAVGPGIPDVLAISNAQAAVLNVQVNTGGVSATTTQSSYLVALNGPADVPTVTSATIGVIGNALSAAAYGNSATSAINLASRNTNQASASVANYQYNAGPVSASVTSVNYGTTHGLGAVTGSALSVTGNSVTATAVGNSAVNAITAGL